MISGWVASTGASSSPVRGVAASMPVPICTGEGFGFAGLAGGIKRIGSPWSLFGPTSAVTRASPQAPMSAGSSTRPWGALEVSGVE